MFNKNFYPTPRNLVERMLQNVDLTKIHTVLEPSAGKGDILDVLKEKQDNGSYRTNWKPIKFDFDCIEKDEELRGILKEKGYRVVFDDFLKFNTMKQYDMIIMNPPFSNGDKHLLKAIKKQEKSGGAIVCLLNAETLKNTYSNSRKELAQKIQEYNGQIEYVKNAFMDAERKTNVEIALIRIEIPAKEGINSLVMDDLKKSREKREVENLESTEVVGNDFIREIVKQFDLEAEAGIKFIREYKAMQPYILSEFETDGKRKEPILSLKIGNDDVSINKYLQKIRAKYWKALFTNKKFIGNLTNNLKREYYNKINELKDYDFNTFNVYQVKMDMNKNMIKGIEDTIIELFDDLGHKYSYYDGGKNIHLFNGWKTNKSYIVNKKVIIPLNAYDQWWGRYQPSYYETVDKLKDIEKCFNYLDNGITPDIDMFDALEFAEQEGETKNIQLKYFTVTFYKKGTCHITFTNLELLKKFNIYGSQKKGWLPPSYSKMDFKDMSKEEQEVVMAFEGEKSYKETMTNKEYYIVDENKFLLEGV